MLNWTHATEKPEDSKRVLLRLSDGDIIRAMWVPKFTKEDNGNYEGDCDYDEVGDCYYWPEGWYEWNRNEEVHWAVSGAEPVEWLMLDALAGHQEAQQITVNAENLRTVLSALNGPPHHIRELQALNKPPFNSPIGALTDQYNAWADKVNAAIEAQEGGQS